MKRLLLLFLVPMAVLGQNRAHEKEITQNPDGTITATEDMGIMIHGDSHCGWLGTWDAGRKLCAISVLFMNSGKTKPITCSPVSKDSTGQQHMICWYEPKERKEDLK